MNNFEIDEQFNSVSFEGNANSNNYENFIQYQDFSNIKRKHSINNKFIDTEFWPSNDSIFFSERFQDYLKKKRKFPPNEKLEIEWIRAKDFCKEKNAYFVLDKQNQPIDLNLVNETNYQKIFNTRDLEQGLLGKFCCFFICF